MNNDLQNLDNALTQIRTEAERAQEYLHQVIQYCHELECVRDEARQYVRKIQNHINRREQTILANIVAEKLAGNREKENCERNALDEITELQKVENRMVKSWHFPEVKRGETK